MQSGLKLFFSSTIFYFIKQTPISYNYRLEHINYATHQKEKEKKKTLTKEIFIPVKTKLKGQENYQLRDLQEKLIFQHINTTGTNWGCGGSNIQWCNRATTILMSRLLFSNCMLSVVLRAN